jgi:hypothetical protein
VNATQEEWRPVVDWEGAYEVSNCGRVRSLDRVTVCSDGRLLPRTGRILQPVPAQHGYRTVALMVAGYKRTRKIHQLVLEAFVGPRPPGLVACHFDGNPSNNHLSNLRWDTFKANTEDMVRHGRGHWVGQTHCKNGHDLNGAYVKSDGKRQCRICHNAGHRARRAKRAAAKAAQPPL